MKYLEKLLIFSICIYIVVLPLVPSKFSLNGIPLTGDTILAAIILLYLIKLIFSYETRKSFINGLFDFFRCNLSLFMVFLLGVMVISTSYSVEKRLAISESFRFATYLILFFIIKYELNNGKTLDLMIKSYIFVTVLLSSFGIIQYFTGIGLNEKFIGSYKYTKEKVASTLENPNNYGAYLILIFFPLIMMVIYERNRIRKFIYGAISFLVLINITLTTSRNAWMGVALGCLCLAIFYSYKLLAVIVPVGVVSMFVPFINHRVRDIFDQSQNLSRIKLWETAVAMIKEHPIRGVGNGNFVSLYDYYVKKYPELAYPYFTRYPSHNSYLKVESELGIFGGVSFLAILITAVIRVKLLVNRTDEKFYKYFYTGFLASMIAFFFMNFSDNLFFVPKTTSYFWLLLSICEAKLYQIRFGGKYGS